MTSKLNLPPAIVRFVGDFIPSHGHLEVLLLLYKSRPRQWTSDEVCLELRSHPELARIQLQHLCNAGLISCEDSEYKFAPRVKENEAVVELLANLYTTHSKRIITLIYTDKSEKIRTFADAFKIRKDEE